MIKTLTTLSFALCTFLLPAAQEAVIRKAPELAYNMPGKGEQLLSQYRGKVVALEFILTTCPHCQAASHVMTKLQERYGKRGFQAIDVAIDPNADLKVDNFSKDQQVNFPVGWCTLQQMHEFMQFSPTDRSVVPQLVLIDRAGNIHYSTPVKGDPDSMKEEIVSQRIEELLNLGTHRSPGTK